MISEKQVIVVVAIFVATMLVLSVLCIIYGKAVPVSEEYVLVEGDRIPGTDYTVSYVDGCNNKVLLDTGRIFGGLEAFRPNDTLSEGLGIKKVSVTIERIFDDRVAVKVKYYEYKLPEWWWTSLFFAPTIIPLTTLAAIITYNDLRHRTTSNYV